LIDGKCYVNLSGPHHAVYPLSLLKSTPTAYLKERQNIILAEIA
jgi:hypothetical protein